VEGAEEKLHLKKKSQEKLKKKTERRTEEILKLDLSQLEVPSLVIVQQVCVGHTQQRQPLRSLLLLLLGGNCWFGWLARLGSRLRRRLVQMEEGL